MTDPTVSKSAPTAEEIMQNAGQYDESFMHGMENRGIRYYYYLNTGLNILNQFRNLLLGIFGLYVILKLENPVFLVLMFLLCLPVLTTIGYYNVHRMNKVLEWVGMRFSSHYAIRQFNYNQGQYDILCTIRNLMLDALDRSSKVLLSRDASSPKEKVIEY